VVIYIIIKHLVIVAVYKLKRPSLLHYSQLMIKLFVQLIMLSIIITHTRLTAHWCFSLDNKRTHKMPTETGFYGSYISVILMQWINTISNWFSLFFLMCSAIRSANTLLTHSLNRLFISLRG